jgi:hypothetical protein
LTTNFRHVVNVVLFLLGDSPASTFSVPTFRNTLLHLHRSLKQPMKMEQPCSETLTPKIQTPGKHPTERIQHSNFCYNSQVSSVCPLLKSSFEDENGYAAVLTKKSNFLSNFPPISKGALHCFRLSNFTCLSFRYLPA